MVYAITYDLNKNGQDYPRLYEAIKTLGEAIHPLQNLWFVHTAKAVSQVRAQVQGAIDSNDFVFVVSVNRGECDCYMPQTAVTWLNSRI